MEWFDKMKGYLEELPGLLNRYSGQSYTVLSVLLAGGAVLFAIHFRYKRQKKRGLSGTVLTFAGLLVFLSLGGLVVKVGGAHAERIKREAAETERRLRAQQYLARNRAGDGEQRVMISDYVLPSSADDGQRRKLADRMRRQVEAISQLLGEDLPEEFAKPPVVQLPMAGGPWSDGIGENNVQTVLAELHGFELIWGSVYQDGRQADTFLGLSKGVAGDFDAVVSLRKVRFEDDPETDFFREGRHRLLGQVMLGMILDSYRRGSEATGDAKKQLFLRAAKQLQKARAALSSERDDSVLKKSLFSPRVDELTTAGLRQVGLSQ